MCIQPWQLRLEMTSCSLMDPVLVEREVYLVTDWYWCIAKLLNAHWIYLVSGPLLTHIYLVCLRNENLTSVKSILKKKCLPYHVDVFWGFCSMRARIILSVHQNWTRAGLTGRSVKQLSAWVRSLELGGRKERLRFASGERLQFIWCLPFSFWLFYALSPHRHRHTHTQSSLLPHTPLHPPFVWSVSSDRMMDFREGPAESLTRGRPFLSASAEVDAPALHAWRALFFETALKQYAYKLSQENPICYKNTI